MNRKNSIMLIAYFGGIGIIFFAASFLQHLNQSFTDQLFKIRYAANSHEQISPDLVVFQLDDSTVKNYRISYSDRKPFALLIDALNKGQTGTILFDILIRLPGKKEDDDRLLQSIKAEDNVIFPVIPKPGAPEIPETGTSRSLEKFIIYPEKNTHISFPEMFDAILPYEKFLPAIKGSGGITLAGGTDGIIRKLPLLYSFKGGYLPSIVLAGICDYLNVPLNSIEIQPPGKLVIHNLNHPFFKKKSLSIPLDKKGNMIINFAGPWEDSICSYSLAPFLSGPPPPPLQGLFKNTLVIVADMTSAKKDFSKGIFNPVLPNSAVLSNAVNTILTNNFLRPTGFTDSIPLIILVASLGFLFLIITRNALLLQKRLIFAVLIFLLMLTFSCYDLLLFISFNRLPDTIFHFLIILFTIIYLSTAGPYVYGIKRVGKQPSHSSLNAMPSIITAKTVDIDEDKRIKSVLKEELYLTLKETDTAVLLLTGKQYKEISGLLGVSESAVKFRVHRIYNKCSVGNKIEFCNLVREKL